MQGNRRISALTRHIAEANVDTLVEELARVSISTQPTPQATRRDVGQWSGGPHYIEFSFDTAWVVNSSARPIPFFELWEVRSNMYESGFLLTTVSDGVSIRITRPRESTKGTINVNVFNLRGRILQEHALLRRIQEAFKGFKFGQIVFTGVKLESMRYKMFIQGPSLNFKNIVPSILNKDDITYSSDYSAMIWRYKGPMSNPKLNAYGDAVIDNVTFIHDADGSGHIIVNCEANDRRMICGRATQMAWGVGGAMV